MIYVIAQINISEYINNTRVKNLHANIHYLMRREYDMKWTFDAKQIMKKDIWSSPYLAFRNTYFRGKTKAISTWMCDHINKP